MIRTLIALISSLAAVPAAGQDALYRLRQPPIAARELSLAETRVVLIEPVTELVTGGRTSLTLPLPGGAQLVATSDGQKVASGKGRGRGASTSTWHGRIRQPGGAHGSATFTVHKKLLSGAIFAVGGVWIIRPLADRSHLLAAIDPDRLPGCGHVSSEQPLVIPDVSIPSDRGLGTPVIDVLALYTTGALQGAGGVAQIEGLILNAAAVTNSAFEMSGVAASIDVVAFAEIDLSQFPPLANLHEALLALQADASIAALRNAVDADLVAAILETGAGLCGYAHAMDTVGPDFESEAFSISVRGCSVANLTFPHEIAHNLGCRHNPENSDAAADEASFPWSFGHYEIGKFRTVMASSSPCGASGCPKVPNFSNPQILVSGSPSGIVDTRDNRRTMNATAPVAAAFRTASLIFADGFESGGVSAWMTGR